MAASQLPLSLSLSFLPGPVAVAHPSAACRQLSDWPTLSTTDEGGSGEPKKTQKGGLTGVEGKWWDQPKVI